jgi:transposase
MKRRDGGLHKSTRVTFQLVRHATFRHRLLDVVQRFPDVRVRASTEWGTTKLCGSCLRRNDPGSSEKYECQQLHCGFQSHRDSNSARLISLINLLPLS